MAVALLDPKVTTQSCDVTLDTPGASPPNSANARECRRSYNTPIAMNSAPVVRPCARLWKVAPVKPCKPRASGPVSGSVEPVAGEAGVRRAGGAPTCGGSGVARTPLGRRGCAAPLGIRVGEVLTDVAEASGAQQGVHKSVNQDIRVGVSF